MLGSYTIFQEGGTAKMPDTYSTPPAPQQAEELTIR
jgi:hypothetical protein